MTRVREREKGIGKVLINLALFGGNLPASREISRARTKVEERPTEPREKRERKREKEERKGTRVEDTDEKREERNTQFRQLRPFVARAFRVRCRTLIC